MVHGSIFKRIRLILLVNTLRAILVTVAHKSFSGLKTRLTTILILISISIALPDLPLAILNALGDEIEKPYVKVNLI